MIIFWFRFAPISFPLRKTPREFPSYKRQLRGTRLPLLPTRLQFINFTSEPSNGVIEADESSFTAGEHFAHEERLGEEFLDFSGSGDCQFILLGKFVHTQDGNNIL
jgi:hypothetical protein